MRLTFLKSLLSIGLLTCCFSGCNTPSADFHVRHDSKSGYTIITDTITLDADKYISKVQMMRLVNVDSYRGGYICLYNYYYNTSHTNLMDMGDRYFFLKISKDGQDENRLSIPVENYEWNRLKMTTKVLNDTLYCFSPSKSFFWEEDSQQWIATDKKMSKDYFEDDTYAIFPENHSQDTLFYSGFMRHGEMHFLMRGSEDTFIAKYTKGKHGSIEKVFSLGNIPLKYNHVRKEQDELTYSFQELWSQDNILNISQDTIRITCVKKNYDTLQYLGLQALTQVLDFAVNNTGKSSLIDVRALEDKIGGEHDGYTLETDWMGNPTSDYQKKIMGVDFNWIVKGKSIEGDHELVNYFHAIDEWDSFRVSYCYQKDSQVLTTVLLELYNTVSADSQPKYRRDGHLALDSVVTQCLSVAPDSKGVWHKGNVTISTFGDKNRIIVKSRQK